jgi:hypothetical protein
VPEPYRTRVRNLLLIDRLEGSDGRALLRAPSPTVQATRSWIFWRQGSCGRHHGHEARLSGYVTETGDSLPDAVWQILFPIQFTDLLTTNAGAAGVDPALVAAVIQQESTFDPGAVSAVGAHGLMQLMPPTGRALARAAGIKRLAVSQLHDPEVGLKLGSVYLREMIDRFGGKIERAVAAYNAGPHRVAVWNQARPGMSAEEFVDSIPFSETAVRHDRARLAGAVPPDLLVTPPAGRRHGDAAVKGFRIGDSLKIDPAILPPKEGSCAATDGPDQLRPVTITPRYTKHAEGSALIEVGDTKVICTVSVEDRVLRS